MVVDLIVLNFFDARVVDKNTFVSTSSAVFLLFRCDLLRMIVESIRKEYNHFNRLSQH